MRYKKDQKLQKVLASQALGSIDRTLIQRKQYAEIVQRYQPHRLTPASRYLYGYALLQTQAYGAALQIFWSLVQAYPALKEECMSILHHVLDEPRFTFSLFSSEELITLWTQVDSLDFTLGFKQKFRTELMIWLWQQSEYVLLERVLKLSSDIDAGSGLENLSKLTFLRIRHLAQASQKCIIDPPYFISHILTGGASLIARKAEYHQDMPKALSALAQELKLLFEPLKHQKSVTGSQASWDHYVDFETSILNLILNVAIPVFDGGLIPGPFYLQGQANKEGLTERIFHITQMHPALRQLYIPEIYQALFWAVSGVGKFIMPTELKTYPLLNPYFRLALWLRAESEGHRTLSTGMKLHDFKRLPLRDHYLRVFVLQTWHALKDKNARVRPRLMKKLASLSAFFPEFSLENQGTISRETSDRVTSIFCTDDPFKILGVSVTASKTEIMQAVMQGIRKCPERMAVFRAAQDQLFHPARRFVQEYLRCFVVEDRPPETESVTAPSIAFLQDLPLRTEWIDASL
jgi:hypothetical protein